MVCDGSMSPLPNASRTSRNSSVEYAQMVISLSSAVIGSIAVGSAHARISRCGPAAAMPVAGRR